MSGDKETPHRLIRELGRSSTIDKDADVENKPKSKKPRMGGGGMEFEEEKDTPRHLIRAVGRATTTSSTTGRGPEQTRRHKTSTVSSSKTPKDVRAAIRGFLKVAETDSREKAERGRDDYGGDEEEFTSGFESGEGEQEGEEEFGVEESENVVPLLVHPRKRGRKPGTVGKRRFEARRPGDIPYSKTARVFKSFMGELPRPNRPTTLAMQEAHTALFQYLTRSMKDYARLARIDDAAPHNLTRIRVEQLLREQGLLTKPLGDEVRRLLDREDADATLGLPMSRARMNRL